MAWKDLAEKRKALLEEAIPAEWRIKGLDSTEVSALSAPKESGILSSDELMMTEMSAVDLVERLAAGTLTSLALTTAFCKRAAIAHQTVSCNSIDARSLSQLKTFR